jgi:hypothetical protein
MLSCRRRERRSPASRVPHRLWLAPAVDSPTVVSPARALHEVIRGPVPDHPRPPRWSSARCPARCIVRCPMAGRPWTRPCVQNLDTPHLKVGIPNPFCRRSGRDSRQQGQFLFVCVCSYQFHACYPVPY